MLTRFHGPLYVWHNKTKAVESKEMAFRAEANRLAVILENDLHGSLSLAANCGIRFGSGG